MSKLIDFFCFQVITVNVLIRDRQITFEPQFNEIRDVIVRCFTDIVGKAESLPRVCQIYIEFLLSNI